jgi:hypothetical protein
MKILTLTDTFDISVNDRIGATLQARDSTAWLEKVSFHIDWSGQANLNGGAVLIDFDIRLGGYVDSPPGPTGWLLHVWEGTLGPDAKIKFDTAYRVSKLGLVLPGDSSMGVVQAVRYTATRVGSWTAPTIMIVELQAIEHLETP